MVLMSLPPTRRSATLGLQALVSGRVEDSLTHAAPLAAVTVRLIDLDSSQDYPLMQRALPDGVFVFYGKPETAFPLFATHTYHLRVEASASNYQTDFAEFDVGSTAGQPALVSFPVPTTGIGPIQAYSFTGGGLPVENILLSLSPNPVQLAGRVVISDEPAVGVDGANVRLDPPTGPSTTTDSAGYFEFAAPLGGVRSVAIRVTATGYQTKDLIYELDFLSPVNRLIIPLAQAT
jgi:hypothetical protein